jgi:hypothetical protein
MARTHAAGPSVQTTSRFHQDYADGGVVTGKGGEPIPTSPLRGVTTLNPHGDGSPVVHVDDGVLVELAPRAPETELRFMCDKTTWGRNMDGWQALHLLNAMLKETLGIELAMNLSEPEARKLPPDTRWHFKRVNMSVVGSTWDEPDGGGTLLERVAELEAEVARLRVEGASDNEHESVAHTLTDEELFDAAPATLTRGQKIQRGKLLARLAREKEG